MENLGEVFETLYNSSAADILVNDNLIDLSIANDDLLQLLTSWSFEYLFEEFVAQEITLERLKYLREKDLDELFKDKKLGLKIEFRHFLTKWQLENNTAPNSSILDPLSSNCRTSLWLNHNHINSPCTSANSSILSADEKENTAFDLIRVINDFHQGGYVLQTFNSTNKLNDAARKIIVDAIVSWHIEHRKKIGRDTFENISIEIEKHFHEDRFIYYKKRGLKQNPSGRLYDKYYNNTKRLRKIGLIENKNSENNSRANTTVTELILDDDVPIEEIENLEAWLKINNEPWIDVQTHWKTTFKKRRTEILQNFSFDNWPLLKHSQGFNLIDIDFNKIYPEKSYGLMKKWPTYKKKLIDILNAKVKDKQNLKLLRYLNTANSNEAVSDIIIAILIHALLPPSVKHMCKENNKKIILKATIKDSQDSMFLHVKTVNDFDYKVEELRKQLCQRNETLQPIIVAVGVDILNISNYYVVYDAVKYKFANCLSAVDACFKTFHVLNLKYPLSSINTWTFFQKFFYDIHLAEDDSSSNLLCLLTDLN